MSPAVQDIHNANPSYMTKSSFLVNLAITFNVTSIPLAVFILILVCSACLLGLILIGYVVRTCIRRKFIPKRKKKPHKSFYLDEVPGAVQPDQSFMGSLNYSLEYNLDRNTLIVGVIEATNLPKRPDKTLPDSYASVRLLEESRSGANVKGKYQKTPVRKNNVNPIWGTLFSYEVLESEIKNIVVVFELFDYDNLGQDNSMGQLRVALKDLDLAELTGKLSENSGCLDSGQPIVDGIGELCVGLGYYPQFHRLDVIIYEARQLTVGDRLSTKKEAKLFVEAELRVKKHSMSSQDTAPRTEVINPYFNEKISFNLKNINLKDCHLICRLKNQGRIGRKKTLGYAVIGELSLLTTGEKHWDELMRNPSKTHIMWHVLIADAGKAS